MNLKKNTISYIAWLILLFFTGATCAFLGLTISQIFKVNLFIAAVGLVTFLLAFLFAIYLVTGFFIKRKRNKPTVLAYLNLTDNFEKITIIVLLAVGLLIRVMFLSHAGEDAAFFEVSKITGESGIKVQSVQGIVYFYCMLLHGLFYIFGNVWIVGIWLQIIMQLIGSFIMYFTIRNLLGRVAAFLGLGILLFSPYSIMAGIRYSPNILYFCIFASVMFFLSDYMRRSVLGKEKTAWMWTYSIIVGALIGVCCYADISGFVLLVLILGLPMLQRENNTLLWWKRTGLIVASSLVVFLLIVFWDSQWSNTSFTQVFEALTVIYKSDSIELEKFINEIRTDFITLIGISCVGCFSFWRRVKEERFSPYIFMVAIQSLLIFTGITTTNMNGAYLLFVLLTVLATVSITELFCKENIQDLEEKAETEMETVESQEVNKIEYIENPLPLPKKHIRKTMDYAFVPEESMMKYDIAVSEKDDFDIK